MFLKLLLFDIRDGLKVNARKYIISLAILAFFPIVLVLIVDRNRIPYEQSFASDPTLGDCLLYSFAGIKPYEYDPRIPFSFPAQWILLILLILFPSLNYVKHSMGGIGLQVLTRVKSKFSWWLSKQVWLCLSIVAFYILAICVILVFGLVFGCEASFQISEFMSWVVPVTFDIHDVIVFADYAPHMLVLFPLCMIALAEIQLLVSIVFSSITSFIVIISYLFFSSYFTSPLLIGNYAMFCRSELFIQNGMSCAYGIMICCIVIFFSAFLGWKAIRYKDFF